MAILRDVLALFTVAVNLEPLSDLDKKINIVKRNIKSFAMTTAAVLGGAGYAAYRFVDAASDAAEQLNVLQTVFKDNSDAVVQWSKDVGTAMGRSEYSFQESVGKFGAFLGAQLKGTDADFEQMSKRLSELQVDLASFYNTTDKKAQQDLFSGMSGETEAVRKYGIDISDAALDDFNKQQGDGRTMRALSMKEKILLRYKKILIDTEQAQGDAVKTADSWANQVKRLEERMKTLSVTIGQKIMPVALKALDLVNDTITGIEKAVDFIENKTSILRGALVTIGSLVAAMAISSVIANWNELSAAVYLTGQYLQLKVVPSLVATAALTAKAALAFLVIEDVIGFLRGQESVIGHFLEGLTGISEPLDAIKGAADSIMTSFMNAFQYAINFLGLLPKIGTALGDLVAGDKDALKNLDKQLPGLLAEGTVDLRAREDALASSRETGFSGAVLSGDIAGARANRRLGESDEDARKRFLSEREKTVKSGARGLELKQEDINAGFVDQNFISAMNDYAKGKPGSSATQTVVGGASAPTAGQAKRGGNRTTIHFTSTKADPKEVRDELEKLMREANAAEGEES